MSKTRKRPVSRSEVRGTPGGTPREGVASPTPEAIPKLAPSEAGDMIGAAVAQAIEQMIALNELEARATARLALALAGELEKFARGVRSAYNNADVSDIYEVASALREGRI